MYISQVSIQIYDCYSFFCVPHHQHNLKVYFRRKKAAAGEQKAEGGEIIRPSTIQHAVQCTHRVFILKLNSRRKTQ